MSFSIPGFTGARIDRVDHMRTNPEALADAMASLSARLLTLDGIDPVEDGEGRLAWGSMADAPHDAELVFLGLVDGKPRFAAVPPVGVRVDGRSRSAWRVLSFLRPEEMALYGAARSLVDWHARHRFCAQCGGPTHIAKGGWQRDCGDCGAQHFPRTDPVVIMLAEHDGAVLVGRQPGFPAGRYSALAGFVEPGESLEEAVARELAEEAGIVARDVRYVASQPWPFPSSLMIACVAQAEAREITLDTTELEDAMWVDRAGVAAAMAGEADAPFIAPPPFAIAHSLFERWLAGG
jgi:NAD+ diphosphatase